MRNLKSTVVSALESDTNLTNLLGGQKVYFHYPPDEVEPPSISYYEADNKDFPFADDLENVTDIIMVIDVWAKGSTTDIAQAVDNVMSGQGFYREFASDLFEQDAKIYHKSMRYRKLKIYDGETGSVPTDSWLEALATWTETELGIDWTVSRNSYPVDYSRPQVIWVITNFSIQNVNRYMYRTSKTFSGIVIGNLPHQQIVGASYIIGGLHRDIKITLDSVDNRYLTVNDAKGDFNADSITVGRMAVTLSRYTDRPQEDIPYMQHVYHDGNVNT